MTGIPGAEDRYAVHDHAALGRWWEATQQSARATLTMEKGTRIYVTETLEELAIIPQGRAFIEVHIVSSAVPSLYEMDRIVHTPALRRLLPRDRIINIAPIVDADSRI